jgi:hypothetical protein
MKNSAKLLMLGLVSFIFLAGIVQATTLNITRAYKIYGYPDNKSIATYEIYSESGIVVPATYPGMGIAVNSQWAPMNLTAYNVLNFEARFSNADNNLCFIKLKTSSENVQYVLPFSPSMDAKYQTYGFQLTNVPASVLSTVNVIEFFVYDGTAPTSNTELYVKNLFFNNGIFNYRVSGKDYYIYPSPPGVKKSTSSRMRYKFNGAGSYVGMGVIVNDGTDSQYNDVGKDLRAYKRLVFDILSDDKKVKVTLKDTFGNESAPAYLLDATTDGKKYVINMAKFTTP